MISYNKRNVFILSIIISILVYISINLILVNFFQNSKKVNTSLVLKTSSLNPTDENLNNKVDKQAFKEEMDEIANNQYLNNSWRIKIQKINLDAPIIEGTSKEVLRRGVGHFENTSKLDGNVCLAAHNRGYKYNYFQEIKKLNIGDEIIYTTEEESRIYIVQENTLIKETNLNCLENTNENIITLITCAENMPEYRVCVKAKQI